MVSPERELRHQLQVPSPATDRGKEIGADIRKLVDQLFRDVPSGWEQGRDREAIARGVEQLLVEGAAWR